MSDTEKKLREAKDSMQKGIASTQESVGMVPDLHRADRFIDRTMRKLEVDMNDASVCAESEIEVADEVQSVDPASFEWNMETGEISTTAQLPPEALMAMIVDNLYQRPEWAARLDKARELCKFHWSGPPASDCTMCERRERAFRKVIAQAFKKYGNPFKPKDRRIQVGRS